MCSADVSFVCSKYLPFLSPQKTLRHLSEELRYMWSRNWGWDMSSVRQVREEGKEGGEGVVSRPRCSWGD